ncbi:MAG: hypothetical protein AAGI48_09355 [Verrucomicrobiota bacterium]
MKTERLQIPRRLFIALAAVAGVLSVSSCQQWPGVSAEGTPYPYVPGNPSGSQTTYDTSSP